MHMDEFERIVMGVLTISPKPMVEAQLPKVQFSNSLSQNSAVFQDKKEDNEGSNNINTTSLANTWSFDVTVE